MSLVLAYFPGPEVEPIAEVNGRPEICILMNVFKLKQWVYKKNHNQSLMYQIRIGRCSTLPRLDIDISIGPYYKAYYFDVTYQLLSTKYVRDESALF